MSSSHPVLVVGSVALDTVETPFGRREELLGGSATFFAYAATPFAPVRLVSVVGRDFPAEHEERLSQLGIDARGLERADGETFRWTGRYEGDMNVAETLDTKLNVLGTFDPKLPADYRTTPFVFLANAHPANQLSVMDQMETRPAFTVCDTMNYWIEQELDGLREVLRRVDGVVLNDEEARRLTGERNLIRAGRAMLDLGPKVAIVKKGEHGAFLFSMLDFFALPAYPVDSVIDPTGAGDSFAGGLMGSLARAGRVTLARLKRAMIDGTVMASFAVESFSVERLASLGEGEIRSRHEEIVQFLSL